MFYVLVLLMSYLEQLHETLKKRNLQMEPYAEVFKWYGLLVEENNKLRNQLGKCHNFILRNSFELRSDAQLKEIQQDNTNILQYKFSTNLMNNNLSQNTISQTYY